MKSFKKLTSFFLIITIFFTIHLTAYAAHPFSDVSKNAWYSDAVDYVYNKYLMSGVSSNCFAPEANMSRAMLVTVLYSMEGKPTVNTTEPFVDVTRSDWFYSPVVWAYKNGIVAGTSASSFSPNSNITREQMVAIFAKYAAYKGLKITAYANLTGYSDEQRISSYAVDAFKWAVKVGIISGTSSTTLEPQGTANRAQCAVILRQFEQWASGNSDPTPTPIPTPTPTPTPPNRNPNVSGETPED